MNNFEMMQKRLGYQGGNQEQRMIKDKYRSFLKTLSYSYQGADVQKLGEEEIHRALINPDKLKQDYDDKIISIDYAFGFKAGDVFKWIGTNTYWLVYLRQMTEDAYFRGEIRRCKYMLEWINQETKKKESTWAYVRGPVETTIQSIQKSGDSVDVPNWSLSIFVTNNKQNFDKFQRYSRFLFDGMAWEVQAVDRVSTDGVIEIIAKEHFINTAHDDKEKNLVDAFEFVPIVPETGTEEGVIGETFIKPQAEMIYSGAIAGGKWSVLEEKRPIKITEQDGSIKLVWTDMKSGQFTLLYQTPEQTYEKVIIVESLF